MSTPILGTKLFIPPSKPDVIRRPRLSERLNEGLHCKLTLVSAPAGFGKTTLLSEWIASQRHSVAWLSLDEGDNDLTRFLTYLIATLQTLAIGKAEGIVPNIGENALRALQAPQPPSTEVILTGLLNEIASVSDNFILVLDDCHVIVSKPVDQALAFLLEHLPPQMHLFIATREDPDLPLARLRARGQLTEVRAADLRFTPVEAAEFLNLAVELNLSAEDIAALEARTEGWIAGLQLAAISMRGYENTADFIKSFTGSHRFVMDYLVEEVLRQQPENIQTFLLQTSILNHMCASLCDAILLDPSVSSQETLEYLERANLFTVSLDNERRWYRYHHLFADLLRQRLPQNIASSAADVDSAMKELHTRASQWYEDHGLDIEAFQHAAAANDLDRAERLIEGTGIPLHLRGAVATILDWLGSLPRTVLDARPSLWWRYASLLLVSGQTTGVEEKLDAAEAALQGASRDDQTRNLIGRIATARSVLALTRYQIETVLVQSRRALEYLDPDNLSSRASANWTLGLAYLSQGERALARQTLNEAISISQKSGDIFGTILSTLGLGNVYEAENQLHLAVETYQQVLQLAGDQPTQIVYDAHLGLARIFYEWNDLDAAEHNGQESLQLAQQYDKVIDRFIVCEVFLARLMLAQGDVNGAAVKISQAYQTASRQNFIHRLPEAADVQILTLLRQGNLAEAARLAQVHKLVLDQARIFLAQGDPASALALLEPLHQNAVKKDWKDELLKVLVLEAVAFHLHNEKERAVQAIGDALTMAEPGGFIRLFVEAGSPMAQLLSEAIAGGIMPNYARKLLAVLETEEQKKANGKASSSAIQRLIEPLSQRELEILHLIAEGLSNQEICNKLVLSLNTVKGHNRIIFDKLQVKSRTEAVARAREIGLL